MKLEIDAENTELLSFICQEAANYKIEALGKLKRRFFTKGILSEERMLELPQIICDLKVICEFWQLVIAFEPDAEIRKQLYEYANCSIEYCNDLLNFAENSELSKKHSEADLN